MTTPSPSSSPVLAPADLKSPGRRSSFGFLHRSKSKERFRKSSGGKIIKSRHSQSNEEEGKRLQVTSLPPDVPKIPDFASSFHLQGFDPDGRTENHSELPSETRTSMEPRNGNIPRSPALAKPPSLATEDPYARTESITNRGRSSYAPSAVSSVDSPRRLRRRKDPTPFKWASLH